MIIEDTLFIIPARGGSKRLPRKNILPIKGKPMICYTIDAARAVANEENICVSTDDVEIKHIVEEYGLKVPFLRPAELATDTAGTREVLLHAIDYYKNELNRTFGRICLLQPTSPLRTSKHIVEANRLWSDELDMVVSVNETKSNPYFNLFEENNSGYLLKSKTGNSIRLQDVPKVWEYNGAIYFINIATLNWKALCKFKKVRKYVMNKEDSIDVDSINELNIIECILNCKH